ncbi:protein boule [Tetranychus urticae]|uniref:RRM domain-containing protein n=1 Tax=Tetranychus urticae TaxID=32264 RepID=T1KW51_TETUR|nr:protein boule [Tetranychus urticae]XP_015791244.1 protein boule [Tetranychus urticae]
MDYPRVLHLGCPYYMGKSCNINGYDVNSSPASPSSSNAYHSNDQSRFGTAIPNRIFVGGLSSDTTEAELQSLFANYGNIIAVKIISEKSGVPKGLYRYGFVTFETEDEARRVLKEADNLQLRGRKLNVAIAIRKSPARLANGPLLYPPNSVPFTTFVNDGPNYGFAGEGLYPMTVAPPNSFGLAHPIIYSQPTLVAQQSPHPCAYPKIDAFQTGQHQQQHQSQTQVPIPPHLYHHHHHLQANLPSSSYPSPFPQPVSATNGPVYLTSGNPSAVISNPVQAMQPMPTGPWRWPSINECIPFVNINPLFGLKQ